jgi:hypothetical protein
MTKYNPWRLLPAVFLIGILVSVGWAADEKKDPEKKDEPKKGTVVGTLTAKGEIWIEVRADGEVKGRRYFPHWRGGKPAEGGGLDKKTLETFRSLKIGSRVRIEWVFEERPRAEKVELLKAPEEKKP